MAKTKHKWEQESDIRWMCLKCGIEKWKVRQVWGGWEYFEKGIEENAHLADQEGLKQDLDNLHFRKIDMSDKVYVCNYDGYIGESTTNEIEYAKKVGKPIMYLQGKDNEMTTIIEEILREVT